MPRLPIDYSKTLIYKIVHEDDYENRNIYIGHTTDFIVRKNAHKTVCNNSNSEGYNNKKYIYIRENGGWDVFKMVEIEKFPCKDKREAAAREEYWRDDFKANLNAIRCFRTPEHKAEYQKEYYKQYRQDNADIIAEQYRQDNIYKKAEYDRQYYEDNADKINQKVICQYCGCNSTKRNSPRHQRTAKCIKTKEALQ